MRRTKQAGGLTTRLAAGDNPRIIIEIAIFNAGGVVLPRLSIALREVATSLPRHFAIRLATRVRPTTRITPRRQG